MGVPVTEEHEIKLVGAKNFKRHNPMSDRFKVYGFHHVDWWCNDATSVWKRFCWGLGMHLVAKSDLSTKNPFCASYVVKSNSLVFAFTAPYSRTGERAADQACPYPGYDRQKALDFCASHGLGVHAIGLHVEDARAAYEQCVANGGRPVLPPTEREDPATSTTQVVSEIELYGDVVLRFVSGTFQGPFLAGYEPVASQEVSYGIQRLDHAVGNVPDLLETVKYIMRATGFHEFAEFTAEDVGTVDSGLNSMVLASNNEMVLMPVNEPTFGTKRKSQIQTFLEQNEGPGLQHLALKTHDIFATMRELRKRSGLGGFDFMPRASDDYYRNLHSKVGDALTPEQYKEVEELGLLVDKDDQSHNWLYPYAGMPRIAHYTGVLLQIFTLPISDRPTVFMEIIQRVGCVSKEHTGQGEILTQPGSDELWEQKGGCGGFGKGNFSELFKSIEEYEKTLDV